MASKKDLKKDINNVLGDIIEAVYVWQMLNPKEDQKKSEKVIDEAIETFDDLIEKVNKRDVENKKKHYNGVREELETRGRKLIDKVNGL